MEAVRINVNTRCKENDMGWNPIKEAEKAAKKVVNKIVDPAAKAAKSLVNKAGDEVRSGVRKAGHEVESGIKRIGHEVESGVKTVGHEVESGVRKAGHEVQDAFEDKLPELLTDALDEILKAAASGALDKALDVIQVAIPSSVNLKIGPLGLAIGDINTKIDTLQRWAHRPPTGHGDIREMVETLSPTAVSIELSFFACIVRCAIG